MKKSNIRTFDDYEKCFFPRSYRERMFKEGNIEAIAHADVEDTWERIDEKWEKKY